MEERSSSETPRDACKLFHHNSIVRAGKLVCSGLESMNKMGTKYEYERRLQLKHFFEDRGTKESRRTWLELQLKPPEKTDEGWVNDGKVRISIGEDRDIKGSFLLSIDEAARLVKALDILVTDHESEKAKLWKE